MGFGGGMSCLKILLFIFNFVFWLLGVAVLSIGIWSRVDGGSWMTLVKDSIILNAANMMIASGIIVAIIGFLGCCGAIRKSQCMLISYAIMILLIFILELCAGIYAYSQKGVAQKDLEKNIANAVKESYGKNMTSDKSFTSAVDWFQQNVKCCGTARPEDWLESSWYKLRGIHTEPQVPESCCINANKGCNLNGNVKDLIREGRIYTEGCVDAGKDFIKKHLWKIGGTGIGVGVIQLLGIIFSICLCKTIRQEDKGAMA